MASQVPNRVTVRLAVIAGVWGVTFVVAFATTLLAEAAAGRAPLRTRLALVAVGIGAALVPVVIPFASTTGRPLRRRRRPGRLPGRDDGETRKRATSR